MIFPNPILNSKSNCRKCFRSSNLVSVFFFVLKKLTRLSSDMKWCSSAIIFNVNNWSMFDQYGNDLSKCFVHKETNHFWESIIFDMKISHDKTWHYWIYYVPESIDKWRVVRSLNGFVITFELKTINLSMIFSRPWWITYTRKWRWITCKLEYSHRFNNHMNVRWFYQSRQRHVEVLNLRYSFDLHLHHF